MSGTPTLRGAGDRAVLVDVADAVAAAALAARCAVDPLPGQVDVVPGAASVLLVLDRPVDLAVAGEHLAALAVLAAGTNDGDDQPDGPAAVEHVVEAVYDGEDLDDVAAATGLGRDEVVAAHTGSPWTVAFAGFAPGFAYLVGGDPRLRVPRRPSSRPRVPAGSVGLAGEHSGVYPRESPGGWQLIARTAARLWDADREPPALLAAGDAVRFVAVDRLAGPTDPGPGDARRAQEAPGTADVSASPALRVERVGLQALVVDAGRPGLAASGVPRSGPMDRASLVAANAAVGNPPWAAALEVVDAGLVLRGVGECVVALDGAPASATVTTVDGVQRVRSLGTAFALRDGEVLALAAPARGLRTYLAVRGGLDVAAVLGSRCTDTLSGLGPVPLAPGDVLAVGSPPVAAVAPSASAPPADPSTARPAAPSAGTADAEVPLHLVLGPRDDWFDPAAVEDLTGQPWRVGVRSDRVGLRLSADQPLRRSRDGEIPTEGVVTGALQVSPDGDLVLFAADHPVTGGYPVIAVVVDADLDRVGQLRPGADVRFTLADPPLTDVIPADPPEELCAPS